jgi:hypothetical protein
MNWRKIVKNTAIITLLSLFIYACDAPPCDDADGVQVNLGFYYFDGNTLQDTLIDSMNVFLYKEESTTDTLNSSIEKDFLVAYSYKTQGNTQSLSLPLSMIVDSSTFIFEFDSCCFDTLTLWYSQYLHMESHECGFVNFYNIKSYKITTNRIDSIWIRKDLVEYGDEENIKIYY